jgi:hypothetical protein
MVSVCEIVPSFYITVILHFSTLEGLSAKAGAQWHAIAFFISSGYETLPAVSLVGIASHTLPGCQKNFSEDGGNPHYLLNPSRPLGVMMRCLRLLPVILLSWFQKEPHLKLTKSSVGFFQLDPFMHEMKYRIILTLSSRWHMETSGNRLIWERAAWNLCNIFQRWSRGNDEEWKLFHNVVPCASKYLILHTNTLKTTKQ